MSLLQISEPGQSPVPHQFRRAAGIDLGTTNSLIASFGNSGKARVLEDERGVGMLPSAVHYAAHGADCVGGLALQQAVADPLNTLTSFKRLMGRGSQDVPADLRYDYVSGPETAAVAINTVAGSVTAVQASAEILKHLSELANRALGGALEGVVITVPAYFDDAQRQATKDAAVLAGLPVLRLINEPTAAALAYGLDREADGTVAVFDLGGGTFDISLLQLSAGVFEVLATAGDTQLGGDDFDTAIVEWVLSQLESGKTLAELSPAEHRACYQVARAAKQALSDSSSTEVSVSVAGLDWRGELSRAQFETLIASLVEKTLQTCRQCLDDAGLRESDIESVVLVGGSTRVPLVHQRVAQWFGCEPKAGVDPDQVVALGAAIQADTLIGNERGQDLLLLDVIPLSLGIETMGGLVEKIIHRNTPIPASRAQEFTTYKDGQTALAIQVLQGERELVDDCRSLARFELRGIPPMVAGAARILVTFEVDADGILSVSAEEQTTGVKADIQVVPSYGLEESQIADMLRASYEHASGDRDARMLAEKKVEASGLIAAVEAALEEDAELLSSAERAQVDQAIETLSQVCQQGSSFDIAAAIEVLGRQTEEFAARRMNQSINRALRGKNIDDVESSAEPSS